MALLRSPRKQPQLGLYSNPPIPILVGAKEQPFYVHHAFLESSKFFDHHPRPKIPSSSASQAGVTPESPPPANDTTLAAESTQVKQEHDEAMPDVNRTFAAEINNSIAPIKLLGPMFDPKAFEIIVNFWYNGVLVTPHDRASFMVLRKAYILALKYGLGKLQDDLIDCCRHYHILYKVQFDDLTWFSTRVDGGEAQAHANPMVRYLIDQIVYEILNTGYGGFVSGSNFSFDVFFDTGDHVLRKLIVATLASTAGDLRTRLLEDPARAPDNRWRVRDIPLMMEMPRAETEELSIIDLD
jgi:hypothetical protein